MTVMVMMMVRLQPVACAVAAEIEPKFRESVGTIPLLVPAVQVGVHS